LTQQAESRRPPRQESPRRTPEDGKVATHAVTFITPDRQVTLEVREDQYLLEAAVEAGLELPYMCLQGWCTTCAGRIVEGKVDQSEALRFYTQDADVGFVLLCSAYPRSNLKVVTHQKEQMRAHRRALGLPAPQG
jgi:ferredoxin